MRGFLRGLGKAIWRFMVIFSFLVNIILVVVLLVAGLLIFDIKNEIAQPLIGGLHSTSIGLQQSTIDWTIPVREEVPVNLPNIPINQNTIISRVDSINGQPVDPIPGETLVTLTRPVPITINNAFINSNDLTLRNATVQITLPAGTRLPVSLDLAIKLEDASLPVNLDVRAVIPLQETQPNDAFQVLGLQFEPLAIALHNLPNNFGEAWDFGGDLLGGRQVDEMLGLTSEDGSGFNDLPYVAWRGFTRTAGLNYDLFSEPFPPNNQPRRTQFQLPGGIPGLTGYVRQQDDVPLGNLGALLGELASGVPPRTYLGTLGDFFVEQQRQAITPAPNSAFLPPGAAIEAALNAQQAPNQLPAQSAPNSDGTETDAYGIIATPTNP